MASRSNMAARSGCVTHRDIIYKTEGKYQSVYLVYPPVTKHTYSGTKKANFSTTLMYRFVTATGLCHSWVLYNDIDDYRRGLERKEKKKNRSCGRWRHVDALSVMPSRWREELAELASLIHQFPLPQESHVQHTWDKQHVWFFFLTEKKKKKR